MNTKSTYRGPCHPFGLGRAFLPTKKILTRYGISQMTLWRWERDKSLGFPKPICINGRKYYDLAHIEAWEQQNVLRASESRSTDPVASDSNPACKSGGER